MPINTDPKLIEELLSRGVEEVIVKEHLEKRLQNGEKLRVKFGIDPTGSDIHIGHAVPLRKLKQFQEAGHQIILLIGDYTAMIGDPSGRNDTRPLLTREQVKENMKTYLEQAGKVIDINRAEVRYNSEWYGQENFMKLFMELTGKISVARILDREDFKKRLKADEDIKMQEILYPVLQGYDSVALKANIEIGGRDQKLNLLMGRRVQRAYGQPEQDILTVPLLLGTDGERKMSKTYDNYIALQDGAGEMYGKVMSIPDKLILAYFELTTEVSWVEIKKYEKEVKKGRNPMELKKILANSLVTLYYNEKEAKIAEEGFASTFSKKEVPEEMPEVKPSVYDVITVLVEAQICSSKGDARRQIEQGGVKVNSEKISALDFSVKAGDVVQKGSRFFVKVK